MAFEMEPILNRLRPSGSCPLPLVVSPMPPTRLDSPRTRATTMPGAPEPRNMVGTESPAASRRTGSSANLAWPDPPWFR